MHGEIKKSVIMYSSYGEKSMNFNPEYKGLPDQVIKELVTLIGRLSEKIKSSVQLGVVNDRIAIIETFSETGEGMPVSGSANANAEVDRFVRDNETLLDAVGKFHYLYFTPEGTNFRKLLADVEK